MKVSDHMKRYFPAKSALTTLKILLFIPLVAILTCAKIYLSAYPIIMWSSMLLFCALYVFAALFWLPLYFKKTVFNVSRKEIAKHSGVFYEKRQLMRVSSVQYMTRIFTPFSKLTGLNFIKFNALGGSIFLLFLEHKEADEIATLISSEIRLNQNM